MTEESDCKEIAEKAVREWFAYQNAIELEMALRMVKAFGPKVVLEIGIAFNGSLACWAAIAQPELAVGMDPLTLPKTPEQQVCFDNLIETYDLKIIPFISRLPEAHDLLREYLKDRKVDFLFIDGEHSHIDTVHDFYEYVQYLNTPSLVGFHDIYYSDQLFDAGSQVNVLWNRLKNIYNYDEFHVHSSMGIGLIYYSDPRKDTL